MLEFLGTASLSWLLVIVKAKCDLVLFGKSMSNPYLEPMASIIILVQGIRQVEGG